MHHYFCEQKYTIFVPMIHSLCKKWYNIACCNIKTNRKDFVCVCFMVLLIFSMLLLNLLLGWLFRHKFGESLSFILSA